MIISIYKTLIMFKNNIKIHIKNRKIIKQKK